MSEVVKQDENRSVKYLDRGMMVEEVQALLTAPMENRERAFFRAIYETFYRANELLQCDIEDYNKNTGELIARHTKNKYNPQTKQHVKSPPKHMILSKPTQMLFKRIIGNRKKGAIFLNKKGERLTKTHFQVVINEIATSVGIQKVTHITETGKEYHLATIKALREAGERHCDLAGADSDVTARGAQHSAIVKEKHYKKAGWEEIQEQVKKYHPAFRED
jgi:site-specific recombinase XerD